jgi:hypothetical protein
VWYGAVRGLLYCCWYERQFVLLLHTDWKREAYPEARSKWVHLENFLGMGSTIHHSPRDLPCANLSHSWQESSLGLSTVLIARNNNEYEKYPRAPNWVFTSKYIYFRRIHKPLIFSHFQYIKIHTHKYILSSTLLPAKCSVFKLIPYIRW